MIHDLKCWPEYFQAVKSGNKPFELRKDDRGYSVGDILHLREFDPETCTYTGGEIDKTVTYVLPTNPFSVIGDGDYVIMGLAPRDWTPCTEGLPDDGEWIFVTVKEQYRDARVASCIVIYDAERRQYFPQGERGNKDELIYGVVAWQKFPDPYRADDTTGKVKEEKENG